MSSAPVTTVGKSRRKGSRRSELSGTCFRTTSRTRLSLPACLPLVDLWKLTSQVPFNSAFMPEAERLGIINYAKSSDGSQKQAAADHQENSGSSGLRHLKYYQYVAGR